MTRAFVGTLGLAVDDASGTAVGSADTDAEAVTDELGAEDVPGTALAAADEIVGTGSEFAGCAAEQPETTANPAMAAQSNPRTDRSRDRCSRILLFTIISVGRALAPLCHRDTAPHDDKSAQVSRTGGSPETAPAQSGMLALWNPCVRIGQWRTDATTPC